VYTSIGELRGFYEPRVPGRYVVWPNYQGFFIGGSSDYRKRIALDGSLNAMVSPDNAYDEFSIWFRPIIRVSDKLMVTYEIRLDGQYNGRGFVQIDSMSNIVFGNRDVNTLENVLDVRYIFKNDLSLNLRLRHYWSAGDYNWFYVLGDEGQLNSYPGYTANHDFNFNSFSLDMIFSWQFAPGSSLIVYWKNNILGEEAYIIPSFADNIRHTFNYPQLNQFSVKVLYYLDYQYLKRKSKNR
jgi:hypothetical protein